MLAGIDAGSLAARFGDKAAIVAGERRISYAQLAELVQARRKELSRQLASFGLSSRPDWTFRSELICHSEPETLVTALALFDEKVMIVPLGPGTPEDEMLRSAETVKADVIMDRDEVRAIASSIEKRPAALGLLSSGSSGKPKLVLRSAEQVAASSQIYIQSTRAREADRVLALLPLEHSYGFHNVFLATLSLGATIIFPGTTHPRAIATIIENEQITTFPSAPLFFDLLVKFCGGDRERLRSLRACISVGVALGARIHGAFTSTFNVPLWQSYGASESGPLCLNDDGTTDGDQMALGRVCEGAEVWIADDDGKRCAEEKVGEMVARSPAVASGYDSEHDGSSRISDGTFYSGDLGAVEKGRFVFRGRRKLLIAAAGHKVDPQEVESVLTMHPKVRDAAVVAHREAEGRELVKALIVLREPADVVELTDFCSRHLAPHKIPRIIDFRKELPRNAMGKLQREQL